MVPFRKLEGINYDKSTGQDDTCFSRSAQEKAAESEKTFSQNFAISMISIFLCIVALCSITYAWFSEKTSSSVNTLTAASFNLDISVTPIDPSLKVLALDDGRMEYTLADAGTYVIALTISDSSTATKGFCDVKIEGQDAIWRTDVIYREVALGPSQCFFQVTTTEENTVLVFTPKWGLPAKSDLFGGGEYTVNDGGIIRDQADDSPGRSNNE